MSPDLPLAGEERESALSQQLNEFLIQLAIGVRRFAIYPPGHPALEPAVGNIVRRLAPLLLDRAVLQIGIARDQLVIEGWATPSRRPVLRELGRRLHDQQLGAVAFRLGVSSAELESFLQTLAPELEGDATPLGLLPARERPTWEHISIYPVGYDQLRLQESASDRATELWVGLAQAAMAGDTAADPLGIPDPKALAETIQTHVPETAYDQVIVGYMLGLADELKDERGSTAHPVRQSVSELVAELDEATLSRLLQMGGQTSQRKRFVLDASQSLAGESVVKVLKAAATASEQTISSSLTRLLSKLAVHSEGGPGEVPAQANAALRDNVEELISNWEQKDPNPQLYTLVLDSMARTAPVLAPPENGGDRGITGPERLVHMSLELDAFGPTVEKAVDDLIDVGNVGFLLDLIDEAPDKRVASQLRAQVISPATLWRLLEAGNLDERSLGRVVQELGDAAVEPLLDALIASDSRALRRRIFDYLVRLGPEAGRGATLRADDARWFVARNILALLKRVGPVPEGFDPLLYVEHDDPRVRLEALALALNHPPSRERALAAGLEDEDERLVRMALMSAQEAFPDALLPTLVERVVRSDHPPELRALGVRALRHSRSDPVADVLTLVVSHRKTLLGRPKIQPAAPDVIAALIVLHEHWRGHPRAAAVLRAAGRSRDPRLRAAAQGIEEAT